MRTMRTPTTRAISELNNAASVHAVYASSNALLHSHGRVAAGIPFTWYVPPPSQNRTWSVTPSGSQLASSTAG
jgi:hypothetical protein